MRKINKNPNLDRVNNFLAITNAYAEQQRQAGFEPKFLSAANAVNIYKQLQKMTVALSNPFHAKHSEALAFVKNAFPNNTREAVEKLSQTGESITDNVLKLAMAFNEKGKMDSEKSVEAAFNSLAGNPVYDHFANINILSGQLYEEEIFLKTMLESGDAINLPIEENGASVSRFRSPSEVISGSPKTYQGNINPQNFESNDSNIVSLSVFSEFKNAKIFESLVNLTQDQRDMILMYEKSIAPALAGFMIQQRLIEGASKGIMKLAELAYVGGLDSKANYIPDVGGSYGLLSSSILLELADAGDALPKPATSQEWKSNPTKLIQKIKNHYFKPANVAAPLPIGDSSLFYKEIVRLFSLPAVNNVDFKPEKWVLFTPTTWYPQATQYPNSGTFNKQLQEMINDAKAGSIIKDIDVEVSSLMNYGANTGFTKNAYNYMVLMPVGSPNDKKASILPGQTTLPSVVALPSSQSLMKFQLLYATGGIFVKQYGGIVVLEFSVQA